MKKNIIIGIGEILWDILPQGKRIGGAPVNFVYHALQNGADAHALSAVGDDENGKEILQTLNNYHIPNSIQINSYPTSTVEVELENGIPTYKIIENVAWDYIENSQVFIDAVAQCDAIGFGSLACRSEKSKKTIFSLLDIAPKTALRVFDINLRENFYSLELIENLLHKCNVLKINDVEMVILKQIFDLKGSNEEICENLIQKFKLKYLIFTVGEKYSIIYSPKDCTLIETPKVEVADTIGAGDAFLGTFIQHILSGETQLEAHKYAVAVAAFVCTQAGAWVEYDSAKIEQIKDAI